jgi:RNA polymerase sigma factor (sigma-70 family)
MAEQPAAGGTGIDDLEQRWRALAALRDDVLHLLRLRLARPQDAEDHVHDAMVRLLRHETASMDGTHLRRLLVRTAYCIAVDRHRHLDCQQRNLPRLLDDGRAPSPEEIVADRSEARWIAAGVDGLGALERQAFAHACDGRRPGEIAVLLGVDYKAAENALSRARRKLRMRATTVVIGLAGFLRRLLHGQEHAAAFTASALAAFLLINPSGSPAAGIARAEKVVKPAPVVIMVASLQPHHGTAPVPVRAVATSTGVTSTWRARAKPFAPAAPPPASTPSPSPNLPNMPWKNSPGVILGGRMGVWLPGGTPWGWAAYCAIRTEMCLQTAV